VNTISNNFLLGFIIIAAVVLRVIGLPEIPFTHDEFSAIFRTHVDSFSELINKSIKLDGHPAGIQLFLYYWTKLFGYSEPIVKIPFICAGVAAVFFIFKIGKLWFNPTVGLISASFMATLEYPVMYSQIARPYGSGLFFSLAMVYYWSRVVFFQNNRYLKNTCFYVLFSILCAYNHHFSLLFAAIVGLVGLFFIKRTNLLSYCLSGFIIFVLYIPHLPLFFYQLNIGGIGGWLGAPHNDFLLDYISYIFHFSNCLLLLLLTLLVYGWLETKQAVAFNHKFFYLSLLLFLLPFVIGFFYSRFFNPVLQYSVLLFSFPFLLFTLLAYMPELKGQKNAILVIIICLTTIASLVFERKYYKLFYNSPYKQILLESNTFKKNSDKKSRLSLIDSDRNITNYYIQKKHYNTTFRWQDSILNKSKFLYFLKNQSATEISYGCMSSADPLIPFLIADVYPTLIEKLDYAGGNFYAFSKEEQNDKKLYRSFKSLNQFEKDELGWSAFQKNNCNDSLHTSGRYSFLMNKNSEWGPGFEGKLSAMIEDKNDFIDVSVNIFPLDSVDEILIVSTLEAGGKTLDWRATDVKEFQLPEQKEWIKVYHTIKLSDTYLRHKDITCKVYIWNKGKTTFLIDDFLIKVRKGNHFLYGITEKI
jgi:hypothetical protein